ncbi:YqeG family HAD IIIA-type phosphatase [Candidatus Phytoplasma phoenicium]|uniref:Hydrolase, HAD subfamily IIIA n=1 Tax=Candidatus Phytoplasma phoenicium TaxID=198422 RepID=A0A0L0MJ13_9MOLU|nr:HAD-IA family hydrolase [Candidatus Phytoplasma phoenicium]KND62637.1 Hydrolase, HAD subfamily IIIA [Candidatus Phytoplasma phoenicium]
MKYDYKYIPKFYYDSIFDIPYDMFYQQGIKALLFDLDNTLILPKVTKIDDHIQFFLQKISLKFKVGILSNARLKKQQKILNNNYFYIGLKWYHKKPSKWGFMQSLEFMNVSCEQAIMIGDQLTTDVLGANKMKIISILVKPLNRNNEFLITKFRRFVIERPFINKIKKENFKLYQQKFQNFIK